VISVPIDSSNGFRRLGRSAFYLSHRGKLQFIAQMRGYQRTRVRINASRDVVGFVDTDQQTQTVSSLLYRDGKMYDLTDAARGLRLEDSRSGGHQQQAADPRLWHP
jgi:hypothetical protein